jgi:hypothetical protein
MRLLSSGLVVVALAVSSHVASLAAQKPPRVQLSLTAVDAGLFTLTPGSPSAPVNGDGFLKQGHGLNNKVLSSGQFDLLGPANKCADGFTGQLVGTFVEANPADTFSYTIDNQLCPTGVPGVYSATGTFVITGGTGKYQAAKGKGKFEGMADFPEAKYKCLLDGDISY